MMDKKISQHDVNMTFLVGQIFYQEKWWMFSKEDIYKLDGIFFMGKYYPHSKEIRTYKFNNDF